MTIEQHIALMDRLTQARLALSVSLLSATRPSPQNLHTRAIGLVTRMRNELANIVAAQRAFDAAVDDEARAAAAEKLMEETLVFELREYTVQTTHLGDYLVVDQGAMEYRIAPYGRWFHLNDNLPLPEQVRIEDRELVTFYEILDDLNRDTGIDIAAFTIQFIAVGDND